jgi:hypothetical protein
MRLAAVFGGLLRIAGLFACRMGLKWYLPSGFSPGCFSFGFLLLAIGHSFEGSNNVELD